MLNNFFRINMPYVIKGNNKEGWLTLNREYKPLGFNNATQQVNYSDYPIRSKFKFTRQLIEKLKSLGAKTQIVKFSNDINIFLYNDGTNPSDSKDSLLSKNYFDMIELLMRLKNNMNDFELKESIKSEEGKALNF